MHHPKDRISHITDFVIPVVEHWLEREIAPLVDLQQGFFYMHHLTDRTVHTAAFVIPVVAHWLEIGQWIHNEGSIHGPIAARGDALQYRS